MEYLWRGFNDETVNGITPNLHITHLEGMLPEGCLAPHLFGKSDEGLHETHYF
jgi:hypothetical protein